MSSNSKTPKLKLNMWDGSDSPKRADFNSDNEILDTVVGSHIENEQLHVSESERAKWDAPFVIGHYLGDGVNTRLIQLNFTPSFIIVYANGMPWATYEKESDKVYAFGGIATDLYASTGIYFNEKGFIITDSTSVPVYNNYYSRLNVASYRYQYIAFK